MWECIVGRESNRKERGVDQGRYRIRKARTWESTETLEKIFANAYALSGRKAIHSSMLTVYDKLMLLSVCEKFVHCVQNCKGWGRSLLEEDGDGGVKSR